MLLAGMMGAKATAAAIDVASTAAAAAAADISTPEAATLTMGGRGSECAFGEDKSVHDCAVANNVFAHFCFCDARCNGQGPGGRNILFSGALPSKMPQLFGAILRIPTST